jgi:hypothetical protein
LYATFSCGVSASPYLLGLPSVLCSHLSMMDRQGGERDGQREKDFTHLRHWFQSSERVTRMEVPGWRLGPSKVVLGELSLWCAEPPPSILGLLLDSASGCLPVLSPPGLPAHMAFTADNSGREPQTWTWNDSQLTHDTLEDLIKLLNIDRFVHSPPVPPRDTSEFSTGTWLWLLLTWLELFAHKMQTSNLLWEFYWEDIFYWNLKNSSLHQNKSLFSNPDNFYFKPDLLLW